HDSIVKQLWQTATASTLVDGTLELRATIDTLEYTITEASVRSKLQLADALGISMLPNTEIFEGMGNKGGGWDQFGSNIATALICLSTGRVYNFSKLIFDGMVANLKSKSKFLMYPRFLQMILEIQTESKHPYLVEALTKKIFGNIQRGFRGVPRPLLPAMLHVVAQNAGQAAQDGTQSQPSSSTVPPPPTSQLVPTESTNIPPTPITVPTYEPSSSSTAPEHEAMEHPFEKPSPEHQLSSPRQESDIPHTQAPTHTHEEEIGHMSVDDLFQLVLQFMTKIESLEEDLKQTKQTMEEDLKQTKQTMGNAIVKLVKKVKKMEKVVKSRRVVLTDSEDEAAKNSSKQGRNL
ncbi:hypothetical protein Tco_1535403, partial [Tanacetum coccineum]